MSQQHVAEHLRSPIGDEVRAAIFGYPLVLMDVTREVMTATPRLDESTGRAPANELLHMRAFPDPTFAAVVSPNADTLYSTAWLDLLAEPVILSVPEVRNRYYLFQMLDAWTNVFASVGPRTTGVEEGDFAIVGPRWRGMLPQGVKEIRAPTSMALLIGRTQANGKQDYRAVHSLQNQYRLTPLSAWGQDYRGASGDVPVAPGVDTRTPPAEQVAEMDPVAFLQRLNQLMKDNPPGAADAEAMKAFAKVGVVPGAVIDARRVDRSLVRGPIVAIQRIVAEALKHHGMTNNGWEIAQDTGRYGTDYLRRAVVALVGLGANLPEDAVYPRATRDSEGGLLTGEHRYEIRFAKGSLPPVRAFWSITAYDEKQAFVANPIERYAIGDRDDLRLGDDGSLTLYVQRGSPGADRESNWLPAPAGSFNLMMRLYWPGPAILENRWRMPSIQRVG